MARTMSITYPDVLDRVYDAAAALNDVERRDARRVVELCRQDHLVSADGGDLRRELGRLAELLGRRGARALPAAALARARLADLGGQSQDRDRALADCDQKLMLFGL